jgi:hypothetical protein
VFDFNYLIHYTESAKPEDFIKGAADGSGKTSKTLIGLVPIMALDVAKMAVVAVLARPLRTALAEE